MKRNFKRLALIIAAVVVEFLFELVLSFSIENLIREKNVFIILGAVLMLVALVYVLFKRKNR